MLVRSGFECEQLSVRWLKGANVVREVDGGSHGHASGKTYPAAYSESFRISAGISRSFMSLPRQTTSICADTSTCVPRSTR